MKSQFLRRIAFVLISAIALVPAGCGGGSGELEMEEQSPDAPTTEDPADMEIPEP